MFDSRHVTAVMLACCFVLSLTGCSDTPEQARDQGPRPATETGQDAQAPAACPPTGRYAEVVDMALFREHQRSERELLDGLHKERRDAEEQDQAEAVAPEAGTPPMAALPGDSGAAPPASSGTAAPKAVTKTAPRAVPRAAPRAVPKAARKSGPWTIAMAPSSFPKGSLERARDQFGSFTVRWLERIRDNMRFSEHKAEVVGAAGEFLARFSRLDSASRELEVKATGTPGCPFVGVLKYLEHHYESHGDTPEQATAGPFRRVKTVRVTEIFRYAGDTWVH